MKSIEELISKTPDEILAIMKDIHEHLAPGLILGIKMILFGLKQISIIPEDRILITSESVRCLQDANFALCNYLNQENNWRVYPKVHDVGKLAIQINKNQFRKYNGSDFVNFRVVLNPEKLKQYPKVYDWAYQQERIKIPLNELLESIHNTPDEIFEIKPFSGKITDLCHKYSKHLVNCPECHEATEFMSLVEFQGRKICRVCAFFEKPDK